MFCLCCGTSMQLVSHVTIDQPNLSLIIFCHSRFFFFSVPYWKYSFQRDESYVEQGIVGT